MTSRRALFLAAVSGPLIKAQYVPKQSDRPAPLDGDEPGFQSIFNGKTLDGWKGDPKYWRVVDGVMTGEITPETVIKSNTFIVWQGGTPEDFELKVDFRITGAGNSGINYRSVMIPDKVTPSNQFAMRGYQCDIDGQNRYTGNNYVTPATTMRRKAASSSPSAATSLTSRASARPPWSLASGIRRSWPPASPPAGTPSTSPDRKSTRLNSSHT